MKDVFVVNTVFVIFSILVVFWLPMEAEFILLGISTFVIIFISFVGLIKASVERKEDDED